MELRFFWLEHQGRVYPCCECLSQENIDLLDNFLGDDGGLGLEDHISWLSECIALCERVVRGVSAFEGFAAEIFAADMYPDQTWIHSNTADPRSGHSLQTGMFLRIVSDWVAFLQRGLHGSRSETVVFNYGA